MSLITEIKQDLTGRKKIVFPEGWNVSIEKAAIDLKSEGLIDPILIVKKDSDIKNNGLNYISIESYQNKEELIKTFFEIRKHKGISIEEASKIIEAPNYFATMLIKKGFASAYVGGIEYTTADTLRPALQIIKTAPGSKIVSSVFVMEKEDEKLLFADCAININPTIENIVEITKQVSNFGNKTAMIPEVRSALLSYATAGSAGGEDAKKMEEASKILEQEDLGNNKAFGSMQFDAAYIGSIMKKKAPDLKWQESANSFIFPNLSAANISYKIAQRLGNYSAIGPIILGLDSPVNDLSRGASIQDIKDVAYISASQIKEEK